ncbi:MAG: xanthine dehydrogenase family protein molybdopterin-binding subunit [Planctomycetales bacterium]
MAVLPPSQDDASTDDAKREYRVLGTRPIRHDGADKVTGRALYGADVRPAGMIHGKILRSPHAHAVIKSIDVSEAGKTPGVLAVMTGADLPVLQSRVEELGEGAVDLAFLAQNVMARDKVLYVGHAVAAVAAASPHEAEEALKKIKVEYEVLPPVMDVLDAMKDDAPLLHEDVFTDAMGSSSAKPSNVAKHVLLELGDVEAAFAEADEVIEREFRTATVHQGYIEPHTATATWNHDGRVTVWTSTQGAFACRKQVAEVLRIPVSSVTVVPMEIGGGFGGKINVYLQPVAALLSRKSGRPVQITMSRSEVFQATGPTPGSFIRMKLGATKDGRLVAGEAWMVYDAGAFPGGMIGPGVMCVFSCYDLPNARVNGFDVVANKPKTSAYRAPGSTHAAFATESVVDELAAALGLDPIEFRLKNAAREGTRRVDGPAYQRIGLVETLEAARDSEHWRTPLEGPYRGRGVACGCWFNGTLKSSATASVNADGTVSLIQGSTDIGGTRTSVAMQLAETLGISAEEVHPQVADTDGIGYTDVTGGSRVTYTTGWAAYEVGLDLIAQLRGRAAMLWECDENDVSFQDGVFRRGDQSLTFKELAAQLDKTGGTVLGKATVAPQGSTNGFAAHVVDLEVDPETGKVKILRYTAVQDAGKAIHPSYVEGQMQGGVAQGIGWALNEEYVFNDQGAMENASFLDYRMPTSFDLPMIDTIIVEVPNPVHPYGVRGVGEVPIVPPPAAVAVAIHQATGLRLRDLPMSPPKVWSALQAKKSP